MRIDDGVRLADLRKRLEVVFELSGEKILALEKDWDPARGTPVFTRAGRYTTQGWTEWTQGFQFGSAILQFDATGDKQFLEIGRNNTLQRMSHHVTHMGVHDHGFNNISTYGNLRRLMLEGKIPYDEWELHFYEMALKASGAVQAARWTQTAYGSGFIFSFNGPHSLFVDTMRSLRSLVLADRLGQTLMGEGDRVISLLRRAIEHALTTARFSVYYGLGRDHYDVRGRVAHESIFNVNDGTYRCPSTQQGYSAFSTWTRGLAWIITGYAELLEFMDTVSDEAVRQAVEGSSVGAQVPKTLPLPRGVPDFAAMTKQDVLAFMREAARAGADFWIDHTPTDGIPYWDTGAPGLVHLGDYLNRPADPYNGYEPVDASAAAIAAQGFLRLGRHLKQHGMVDDGERYIQAGLTMARALFHPPYLSEDPDHQGLLLHTVYHRPNGWDYVPEGSTIPHSESAMWGDYHLRELALMLWRELRGEPYLTFFSPERK